MELLAEIEVSKSILIILAAALWLYWLWTRRDWYRFALKFPCYFGLPLVGTVNRIRHPKDVLRFFTKFFEESKQNTITCWMGMYLIMVTADPDIIVKILSSSELLDKSEIIYQPVNDALQGGILSSPAKEWSHHRKLINASFNHKVIVNFLPIFHKAKKQILSKFDALVGTGEHKLSEMILQTIVRMTVETTMGKVVKEDDKIENFVKFLVYCMKAMLKQMWLSFFKLKWLYFFNPRYHKAKNYAYNFVHELVISKLELLHEIEKNGNQPETMAITKPDDSVMAIKKTPNIFIDQIIQIYQKQQFTWNDIIAESNTIVVTSFETISTAILSTLVMLAMHPDVQEKLYEEIVGVFPEKDFQMVYEHMEQLPYLDMVINETMRVVPPVPLIARQPAKDTQLTNDILLPKGLQVMVSIFHLHRSTEIWGPNANKFDPDHFLPGNLVGKHSHAFIPFAKGARNCIGWRYALLAMKVLLVGSVRNFSYTTTFRFEDLEYVEGLTLKYLVEPGIQIHRR